MQILPNAPCGAEASPRHEPLPSPDGLINLRALLSEHRTAIAALSEATAEAEARQAEWERRRTIRRAEGRAASEGEEAGGNAVDRLWDEVGERFGSPEAEARARLGAAVRIALGIDPYAKDFDRHRAVVIDGALVVTIDRHDDTHWRSCIVIEADDVMTLLPAAPPVGIVDMRMTPAEAVALEEARRTKLQGRALIEKLRTPESPAEAARAIFELLDDHWSLDGGWSLSDTGGRSTVMLPTGEAYDLFVSHTDRADGKLIGELDEAERSLLAAWNEAGRPAINFTGAAPAEFEQTFRFINFPKGELSVDLGVRVVTTSDEAAGMAWLNREACSSMRLDDGRIMTVGLIQAGDNLEEDPAFNAYGRDNVEPAEWLADIRLFRDRLLAWLESLEEVSSVKFRAGGNGYGVFRVVLDEASVMLGLGRDPDA